MPYVTNQGVRIHYEIEGQGLPLAFMPGLAGTLDDWRILGYTQILSKEYQLILIDPRGRGASDKPHDAEAYNCKLLVEDVVVILDELKIRKAHYFGYSWGGLIGWSIPIYAPGRFSSLILGGSRYPLQGHEQMDSSVVTAIAAGLEMALKEAPDRPMEFFVSALEKKLGPYPPERRAQMLALDPNAVIASFQGARHWVVPKAEEVLPSVTIPYLVFVGETDPWYPRAKECARLVPNATFFSLPGLGHVEALARSDLVLPHVRKFLTEVSNKSD